jgi:hypothetical protein
MKKHIEKLHDLLKKKDLDLVNGFKLKRRPIYRFFISRCNNAILNSLFFTGVQDANAGCKLYKKEKMIDIVEKCSLKYNFNTEQIIKARKSGIKIGEVGVRHFSRDSVVFSKSKLGKIIILAVLELIAFRMYLWREKDR